MKRTFIVGALLSFTMAIVAFVAVPVVHAADLKVTGVVLDSKCTTKLNKPADPCHATGAQKGDLLIIRGKDNKTYNVVGSFAAGNNAKLLTFIGKNVVASGKVTKTGTKNTIDITSLTLAK